MIAFGCAIVEPAAYSAYAQGGIVRAAEPDSQVFAFSAVGSIARSHNLLLDTAMRFDDLEALVLVHPYAEIDDPELTTKVRALLAADTEIGVIGALGARGVRSVAWWEDDVVAAPGQHQYIEHGGGRVPAYEWTDPSRDYGEVDMVEGFLMVMSPWAVANVRFDEGLHLSTGFDLDYCLQVRAAGRKVVVADLRLVYHRAFELVPEQPDAWLAAHQQIAEKWEGHLAAPDEDWQDRARRAEAEAEAERAMTYSAQLRSEARLASLERSVAAVTTSRSWRATAAVRRVSARLRERRSPS